jgi:hypothetical protein
MRVYHFIDRKCGLQALRRKRQRVALIDQLDDPFELPSRASSGHSLPNRQARAWRGSATPSRRKQLASLHCDNYITQCTIRDSTCSDRSLGECLRLGGQP